MTALAGQQASLECTINIVDAFTQNLEAMKARKKATRVTSLKENEEGGSLNALKPPGALAQQDGGTGKMQRRRSGRRLPRKSGNSSTNLAVLKDGLPGLHRSNTDPSISLAERVSKLKKKTGCTVDPDEWLAERRQAKRDAERDAEGLANGAAAVGGTAGGGRRPRRGMPRKTGNSSSNLTASPSSSNISSTNSLPGLQRCSTDPTLSLQQRMEKLKAKQKSMPDNDDSSFKKRQEAKAAKASLFGSAPNLPGAALDDQDRKERRRRRSTSRGRKLRISRTTSAGRLHDEKELPVLVSYSNSAKSVPLKRSCTDTGVYADLVAKMELQKGDAATSA